MKEKKKSGPTLDGAARAIPSWLYVNTCHASRIRPSQRSRDKANRKKSHGQDESGRKVKRASRTPARFQRVLFFFISKRLRCTVTHASAHDCLRSCDHVTEAECGRHDYTLPPRSCGNAQRDVQETSSCTTGCDAHRKRSGSTTLVSVW